LLVIPFLHQTTTLALFPSHLQSFTRQTKQQKQCKTKEVI